MREAFPPNVGRRARRRTCAAIAPLSFLRVPGVVWSPELVDRDAAYDSSRIASATGLFHSLFNPKLRVIWLERMQTSAKCVLWETTKTTREGHQSLKVPSLALVPVDGEATYSQ